VIWNEWDLSKSQFQMKFIQFDGKVPVCWMRKSSKKSSMNIFTTRSTAWKKWNKQFRAERAVHAFFAKVRFKRIWMALEVFWNGELKNATLCWLSSGNGLCSMCRDFVEWYVEPEAHVFGEPILTIAVKQRNKTVRYDFLCLFTLEKPCHR
jgi:hypothetical protein